MRGGKRKKENKEKTERTKKIEKECGRLLPAPNAP